MKLRSYLSSPHLRRRKRNTKQQKTQPVKTKTRLQSRKKKRTKEIRKKLLKKKRRLQKPLTTNLIRRKNLPRMKVRRKRRTKSLFQRKKKRKKPLKIRKSLLMHRKRKKEPSARMNLRKPTRRKKMLTRQLTKPSPTRSVSGSASTRVPEQSGSSFPQTRAQTGTILPLLLIRKRHLPPGTPTGSSVTTA